LFNNQGAIVAKVTSKQCQFGNGVISMPEITNRDTSLAYSSGQVLYGQSFLESPRAEELRALGYILVPTLPWIMNISDLCHRVATHQVIDDSKDYGFMECDVAKAEKAAAAQYLAFKPLPVKNSLNENWQDGVSYLMDRTERLPTAVELVMAAVVSRIVRGWILAPGYVLRTSTVGSLTNTHIGVMCTQRDGVSIFSIRDDAKDVHLGVAALRVI
jgi:hypothetical protein